MSMRTFAFISSICLSALLVTACGKDKSPTGPTTTTPPPTTTTPPPPAAPTAIDMDGTVKETAPTASTPIVGATVRIASGESAGAVQMTDGNGYFVFRGIRPGNFSVEVSAPGFDGMATGVTINASGTRNFNLAPNARTISQTFNDSVNGGSPRCPDFYTTSALPCVQYPFATHHPGRLSAVLTWPGGSNRLELALLKAPRSSPDDRIVISRFSSTSQREEISVDVQPGVQYYLHVLYDSGNTVQPFTLVVSRPN